MQAINKNGNVIELKTVYDWICGESFIEVFYDDKMIGTIVNNSVDVEDEYQLEIEALWQHSSEGEVCCDAD